VEFSRTLYLAVFKRLLEKSSRSPQGVFKESLRNSQGILEESSRNPQGVLENSLKSFGMFLG
jgi:hypothetical protein